VLPCYPAEEQLLFKRGADKRDEADEHEHGNQDGNHFAILPRSGNSPGYAGLRAKIALGAGGSANDP